MNKTNAHKPGYKHTPIGWIPEEWEIKELGDIGKLSSGTTPSRQRNDDFFLNGIIPWVKTTDLNNTFIIRTEECVTEKALQETSLRVYPIGSILVAMYGGFNQIGRTGLLKIPATVNQALTVIQLSGGYEPQYVLECLNHRVGYWKNFAGSSRKDPNITSKDVADFPIVISTLQEQQKIVTILTTWDEAIQKTQHLIDQLKQRNKGLMQQLLTGKKRLKGFGIKWKKVTIGDIIKESRIPSIHNDVSKRITVKLNLKGIENRDVRGSELEGATAYFTRKAGQFIYGKQNLHKGAFGIIPPHLDGFDSSQDIPAFDFIGTTNPKYFLFYMSQERWYEELENISTGTGSKRIHPDKLFKLSFDIPIIEEQNAIVAVIEIANRELKLYEQHLTALQQQKKGLMQKLLSGEVRVKI